MITKLEERIEKLRERMREGKGTVKLKDISKELPKNARLLSEIRLAPGTSIGYHVHENETEIFYFIEGAGVVMDDDTAVPVKAGDSLATFAGHGHSVENTGDTDLVMVAVIILD